MNTGATESIWGSVRAHSWKYRTRTTPPRSILLHITGSGTANDTAQEYRGTKNWFISPNNVVNDPRYPPYGGVSHLLAGLDGAGGYALCEVVPVDGYIPAFSSYPSDEHAVSIEVALARTTSLILPELVRGVAGTLRLLAGQMGTPLVRVRPAAEGVADLDWTGLAGHADTWQGRASTHVDPGEPFWAALMAELQEAEMTPEQERKLDAVYNALCAGDQKVIDAWNANGNSMLLGYAIEQRDQDAVEASIPGLDARLTALERQVGLR